ncbi:hypothetical protein DFH09DRAFT_1152509 [Mycena vulgaris]|nr:hypothetical protein DFH09DRAFT_1152509 [Mycena vulgaris]
MGDLVALFNTRSSSLASLTLIGTSFSADLTHSSPARKPLIAVNVLDVTRNSGIGWLIHPQSPFDLSGLKELRMYIRDDEDTIALTPRIRTTLERMYIRVVNEGTYPDVFVRNPGFPALTQLEITMNAGRGRILEPSLASIWAGKRIEHFRVSIHIDASAVFKPNEDAMRDLDATISNLHARALRTVEISLVCPPKRQSTIEVQLDDVRRLFPGLDGAGMLRLKCVLEYG